MICPYCKGKTKVEECASETAATYRRRICPGCRKRLWTEERPVSERDIELKIRDIRNAKQIEARRRK